MTEAAELEDRLYGVPGVVAARVVGGIEGAEIGILVRPEVNHDEVIERVRQLVSSTEETFEGVSLRVTSIGANEDVTVLELFPPQVRHEPEITAARRLRLKTVTTVAEEAGVTVEVVLTDGVTETHGRASGWRGSSVLPAIVARATLDALTQLHGGAASAYLEAAQVIELAGMQVAVVLVVLPHDEHDEALAGTGVLRSGDRADGIARAVLDATNRRLARADAAVA